LIPKSMFKVIRNTNLLGYATIFVVILYHDNILALFPFGIAFVHLLALNTKLNFGLG